MRWRTKDVGHQIAYQKFRHDAIVLSKTSNVRHPRTTRIKSKQVLRQQ